MPLCFASPRMAQAAYLWTRHEKQALHYGLHQAPAYTPLRQSEPQGAGLEANLAEIMSRIGVCSGSRAAFSLLHPS